MNEDEHFKTPDLKSANKDVEINEPALERLFKETFNPDRKREKKVYVDSSTRCCICGKIIKTVEYNKHIHKVGNMIKIVCTRPACKKKTK